MDKILIIDFGSQFTQLIARRVREFNVYSAIKPYTISDHEIEDFKPNGIILSGGPNSSYLDSTPKIPEIVFKLNIPILGICYGMQAMAMQLGGKVESSSSREFGYCEIFNSKSKLFANLSDGILYEQSFLQVWMSHGDKVTTLPDGFEVIAESESCKIAAMANFSKNWYGLQFHPEVTHTKQGSLMLSRFVLDICQCNRSWTMANYVLTAVNKIKEQVKNDKVILALSGGVDSTVAAILISQAIKDNLICIFVDTGLLRHNEASQVMDDYQKNFGLNISKVDAHAEFFTSLANITDPEEKRKICGRLFIEIFEREAKKYSQAKYLAQGTIYPDVIESAGSSLSSHNIKSHHNVGGLPEKLNLQLLEPLRELFKDEVRTLGLNLNIPRNLLYRHPFPGPGLAVRILGDITKEKVTLLQKADAIFIAELIKHNLYDEVSQAFAVFLPVKSVGVMGDARTYDYVVSLRAVVTTDFMTATVANLPFNFITNVANKIINEVPGINRVVYDISGKPPATIEWE